MGVLNITPDSFSDGGNYLAPERAFAHSQQLISEGADIIDIGGESSRPYAKKVSLAEELERIIPVITYLKKHSTIKISVDTYKAEVMQQVLELGVDMINDIYALRQEGSMEVVAASACDICLMHMQGDPQTMQNTPYYDNVTDEIMHFFEGRLEQCARHNIDEKRIILDPGIGFGKTLAHNLELIRNLPVLKQLGLRVLIGVSAKSMFDKILGGRAVEERLIASTACNQIAVEKGADIIRTHHPLATSDMLKVLQAINNGTASN